MGSKVIIFSAVLVLMSFTNVHGSRPRRSAERELQMSLMDIIHGDNVESRIWKRAAPREIKKSTKSNEVIPDINTNPAPLYDTQPNVPKNSEELFEHEIGTPIPVYKKPRKTGSIGTKAPSNTKRAYPNVVLPRNPKPNNRPNSPENPDDDKSQNDPTDNKKKLEKPVEMDCDKRKEEIVPEESLENKNEPKKKVDDEKEAEENEDDEKEPEENTEDEEEPEENAEDEKEPEEDIEDEKEPEENTEDEEEPEENTENEKEPEENTEDEKEPEDNTEDEEEPEKNTEDEKEPEENIEDEKESEEDNGDEKEPKLNTEDEKKPEENTENEEEPEKNIEDKNKPEESTEDEEKPVELNKNIEDEIPRRPKLPAESKSPRKPSSFPKLPRPTPRRPKKPPPPFPGDLPTSTSKKSQKDSPITYIRPFRKLTTPQPSTTENPESDDEKPDDEVDNSDENPTPPPTQTPKRKSGTKNLPKASGRPRGNITPVKTTNKNNKATKPPPVNCNESLPESDSNDSDDVESYNSSETEKTPDDNSNNDSEEIPITTTARPRSGVKTRPRNPTKQRPIKRPSEPKNSPSYTTNNENSNTTPNADETFDLTSRIDDTNPDTQQPENTEDTPITPSESSKRPQNPKPISPPDDTYRNNPFLFPPFDSSFINGFSSTGTTNGGASATASASSNTGVPAWSPWPNFFPNRFNSPPMMYPPMFSNNPFINIPNSPDDQQRSDSPSTPDSSTNNNDPTENQPIKNNPQSSSSSQLEPKGYTPIISISGSFDPNEHSVSSRSSFPSSDPSSDSPNDHDSQINFNAPSHGPMGDPNFNPFSGQMPDQINPNSYNGYPSTAGGFASASSFSSAGAGGMGSSLSSSMYDGESYPRNYNNNGGFPADSEAQIGSNSFSNPNWVNDQINSIQKQIQDQQRQFQQSFGFPSRGNFGGEAESQQFGFPSDSFGYQQPQQPQEQYPSFPSFSNDPFQSSGFGNFGGNPGFAGYNGPSQGLGQPGAFGQSYGFASAGAGQPGSFGQGIPSFQSRFPDISPSGGSGTIGSFSSSKMVTEIGPDGKPVTHEVITTGTTKDGKTSVRTYKSS